METRSAKMVGTQSKQNERRKRRVFIVLNSAIGESGWETT